jgi:hypothetical protein
MHHHFSVFVLPRAWLLDPGPWILAVSLALMHVRGLQRKSLGALLQGTLRPVATKARQAPEFQVRDRELNILDPG